MRKKLLMVLLPLLAISIAFSVLVPAAQTWTVGGFAVHQEDEWKAKYEALKADYDTLLAAFNILQKGFDTLRTEVEKIKSGYETLTTEVGKLRSEYDKLNSDYMSLSSEYESAVRQLNTTKSWMYFFILTTIVSPLATIAYFVIIKRKAKP